MEKEINKLRAGLIELADIIETGEYLQAKKALNEILKCNNCGVSAPLDEEGEFKGKCSNCGC